MSAILTALATVIATATPAFAFPSTPEGFSGVFLWVFGGYCAIIIVTQTLAAFRSLADRTKRQAKAAGTNDAEG